MITNNIDLTTEDLTHQWQSSLIFVKVIISVCDDRDSPSAGNVLGTFEHNNGITTNESQLRTPPCSTIF